MADKQTKNPASEKMETEITVRYSFVPKRLGGKMLKT